jgi:hypothetical protein
MSNQPEQNKSVTSGELKSWLARWPAVRNELESLLAGHVERDPSLHFELALAKLELQDIDENVRRIRGMGSLLMSDDLTSAELEATGN